MIKPPPETGKCCRYDCRNADKKPSEYPCYFCTCNRKACAYYKQFRYEGKGVKQNAKADTEKP